MKRKSPSVINRKEPERKAYRVKDSFGLGKEASKIKFYGSEVVLTHFTEEEIEKIFEYVKDIYPEKIYKDGIEKDNDSYAIFYRLRNSGPHYIFQVKDLYNWDIFHYHFSYMPRENLMMSFNTFTNGHKNNRVNSLFGVRTIVIDIDWKKFGFRSSEEIMYILEQEYFNSKIPIPNYIEFGNQMKLIYILSEPAKFKKYTGKTYRDFVQFVSNFLTNQLKELGGDTIGLNTYIRVPFSLNVKSDEEYLVTVEKYSDYKYTFQEIVDEFLPDLPSWYTPRSERKKKKKRTFVRSIHSFNREVLVELEFVQEYYNKIELEGHREILCFLYKNYCLLLGQSEEEAKDNMIKFNENWKYPLSERTLISQTNNTKKKVYRYSKRKLMEVLDIDDELSKKLKLHAISSNKKEYTKEERQEYNHNYYLKHSKREQRKKKVAKIKKMILALKDIEYETNSDIREYIEDELNYKLSLKTIEYYIHCLILEGKYTPKRLAMAH